MRKRFIKIQITSILTAILLIMVISPIGLRVEAASQVVVDWNNVRQTIDGFGVTQEEECTYVMAEPYRSQVMDLLYSKTNGIGLSLLRTEIGCGESKPTIEPSDGVWNYEPDVRELWYFNEAKARGVEKIFGTVWSPPAWMKTNNKVTNGGYLRQDCYQKYAEYLAQYVKIYKDYHDIDIYGVSIANEPEYAATWKSCLWTASMFKDFIGNYLKPTFENQNIAAKVIAGEMAFWSEAVVKDALNDPAACSRIDVVAAHQYQGFIKELPTAKAKGKKIWMTELSDTTGEYDTSIFDGIWWAKKVHKFMTVPEVSAFCYWRGAHTVNNNQTLIHINPDNQSYIVPKRLYTIGHYSKFVRPGYVRIGATENPVSGVYVTAYKDAATGDFAIVVINENKDYNRVIDIVPQGFSAGKITPYLTNKEVSMQQCSDVALVNGKFTVSVGAESITTFVGINGSPVEQQVQWTATDDLNDWSKVYSLSPHWMIETGNDYGRYDEDSSCARRTVNANQSLIYRYHNISNFLATIYFCDNTEGIKFYTSTDNVTWMPLDVKNTVPVATTKDWHRVEYSPSNGMPQGTNYLKLEFSGGANEWNKHLAKMNILCDSTATAEIVDTLDDFSKAHSYSNMTIAGLDGAQSQNFDGDIARASRQTNTPGEIVYSVAESADKVITDFTAKLYYYDGNDDNYDGVNFYVSSDGINWTELSVTHGSSLPTRNYWYKLNFNPLGNIPAGTKYLKVQLSKGAYAWNKQLSEIMIYCNNVPVYSKDCLDDWSKSYYHSANMAIFDTDPSQAVKFDGDTHRAARTADTPEHIIYHIESGIRGFIAKFYFQNDQNISQGIQFYTSPDNVNYTQLNTVYTSQMATIDAWRRIFFSPSGAVPEGTKYIKVEISSGSTNNIEDKQLAEIVMSQGI